jgi:dolichol kinase
MEEKHRQLVHASFGIGSALLLTLLDKELSIIVMAIVLLSLCALSTLRSLGWKSSFLNFFLERFERRKVQPLHGAISFAAGALLVISMMSKEYAIVSLLILGVGDALSTVFGVNGKKKLFWNEEKTWAGTLAFVLSTAPIAFALLGFKGIAFAVVMGLVESLPLQVNDNLALPVTAITLSLVI